MNDKIDALLDSSNVSQIIFDRGFNLYNTNGVELIDFNNITQTASLWIRGMAGRYLNNVDWKNQSIVTNCTCPYNNSSYCKHNVASLLFLKNHSVKDLLQITLENEFPEAVISNKSIKKRTSSQPYELGEVKIWHELKKEHVIDELYTYQKPKLTFDFITDYKIEVSLPIDASTIYNDADHYKMTDKAFRVKYFIENNNITTTCNCNHLVNKLCKHQAYATKTLLETSDVFKAMDGEFIDNITTAHFKKIGLSNTPDNKSLFQFSYINGKFTLVPSSKSKGLISFKDDSVELSKTLGMVDFLQEPEIILSAEEPQELIKLTFAIKFTDEKNELFKIIPLSAKLNKNKTKLTSSFKELKYIEEIDSLEANQSEIIFAHQIKELKDYNNYLENSFAHVSLYEIRQKCLSTVLALAKHSKNIDFFYEQR